MSHRCHGCDLPDFCCSCPGWMPDYRIGSYASPSRPAEPKCPCKQHRSYQAKRRPQGNCEACWRFYVEKNP